MRLVIFLTTFSYHLFLTTLRLALRLQRAEDHIEHKVHKPARIARGQAELAKVAEDYGVKYQVDSYGKPIKDKDRR